MKLITEIFLGMAMLATLAIFSAFWLWFMIRRAAQWASFVNRENIFWSGKKLISPSLAEKFRRLETGMVLKLLVGAGLIINVGGFLYIAFLIIRSKVFYHQ
jgi:hypothetical protein